MDRHLASGTVRSTPVSGSAAGREPRPPPLARDLTARQPLFPDPVPGAALLVEAVAPSERLARCALKRPDYITVCSTSILNPIAIRMTPPRTRTSSPRRSPTREPRHIPQTVSPAVITLIAAAGYHMVTCNKARLSPAASASMPIATERTMRLSPRVGSRARPSTSPPSRKTSRIAFPPIKTRSAKATQWSQLSIWSLRPRPTNHPATGIAA